MTDPNERYRRLVELSPDGILISQNGCLIFLNPAAASLLGAERPEDALGRPLIDLFHPKGQARIRGMTEQLMHGQLAPVLEEAVVSLGGSVTDVEVAGTLIDESGDRAIQIIMRDLSQRRRAEAALRESEERLQLAFAGAQEGVWDWNLETGAVVYSDRWKQMLGYADDEIEPHVKAWERLLHPEDWPRARELNDHLARGGRTYEGEFRLKHKDGHFVHVLSRGYPIRREPGGPVVRIVGTHFDLTERRKAEAERTRTEVLARLVFAQEDERRRIAREMHDQFGEQLTGLALRIAALKESTKENATLAAQVESLATVAQQLDRDVDHLVWELRPTALDDLGLRAALTNYIHDWSARVGVDARLHTTGLMDDRLASELETTLYRIAQEALNNVAKHANAKSVEIILERRADHVLLIIEDDGVGFETGSEETSGDGFGLLGMQERAALVGANLEIESTPGSGTTILVRLPADSSNSRSADNA